MDADFGVNALISEENKVKQITKTKKREVRYNSHKHFKNHLSGFYYNFSTDNKSISHDLNF